MQEPQLRGRRYGSMSYRAPSDAIEHLATRPPLRTSMSRVLSRCLSINRKTKPPPQDQASFKDGSERHVSSRDYEIVPRITSTHLARTGTGTFREVSLSHRENGTTSFRRGMRGNEGMEKGKIDWEVGFNNTGTSNKTGDSRFPYYAHPLFDEAEAHRPRPPLSNSTSRKPTIQPKLSRGQIQKFRSASGASSVTEPEKGGSLNSSRGTGGHRRGDPLGGHAIFGQKSEVNPVPLISKILPPRPHPELPDSTPRRHNEKYSIPPVETRRHLASSRSTAEMKGYHSSPTTPTHPLAHRRHQDRVTPDAEPSFHTSTPIQRNNEVIRFPFVCPDKLVQRHQIRPTSTNEFASPSFAYSRHLSIIDSDSPAFPRPIQPPRRPPRPVSTSFPNYSPEILAGMMEYGSSCAIGTSSPVVDPETLDKLFNEVMQACTVGVEQHHRSPSPRSDESLYSAESGESTPVPMFSRFDRQTFGSPSTSGSIPISPTSHQSTIAPSLPSLTRVQQEPTKRFIPSGRSFEPLKAVQSPNIPMSTGGSAGGSKVASLPKGRVREAIEKFEGNGQPTTPVRVLGEILDRPGQVDSNGLSSESRRLMFEARLKRLPR